MQRLQKPASGRGPDKCGPQAEGLPHHGLPHGGEVAAGGARVRFLGSIYA